MSETPEADKPPRRWWLRMIVASAALVAVLLGVVWVTPVVKLHYHAWQWRKHKDMDQLKAAARILRDRKAHYETVKRILGPPDSSQPGLGWGVEGQRLLYSDNPTAPVGGSAPRWELPPYMIDLRFDKEKRLTSVYESLLVFSTFPAPLKLEWTEVK